MNIYDVMVMLVKINEILGLPFVLRAAAVISDADSAGLAKQV